MKPYNHQKIEKKWRKVWDAEKTYQTLDAKKATAKKLKPYYVLDMFPYPSGSGLHVGHPRGYIASDVFARMKRMQGYNVLHPMGFDSFGLPAEQYAIQTGKNPGPFTETLVKRYREQLSILGFSYDWSREVATHRPEYYRWTQWIFLKIYECWYDRTKNKARPVADLEAIFAKSGNGSIDAACNEGVPVFSAKEWKSFSDIEKQNMLMNYRLAYEGYSEVNWCPELGTVLANDEIVEKNGQQVSERGEFPVEKKSMRQWFMRITAYADRLIDGLDTIDWPENIKEIQRNWIGKSEGMIFSSPVKGSDLVLKTFSAHFEACYADTFLAIAPDHPLLEELVAGIPNEQEVLAKAKEIVTKRNLQGDSYKEIEGVFTGRYTLDPLGNGELPIWVASFALANYGTGIVKCSCHDERDFAFAKKYGIKMKAVMFPKNAEEAEKVRNFEVCFTNADQGVLSEPSEFAGKNAHAVRNDIIAHLEKSGLATRKTTYKMRDAIFARQRYWGEPIPLVHEKDGGISEVKEKNLPLKLPAVKSYQPSGTGESPLSTVPAWVRAGYETNTMPGWAGSSWYFLRYMDPQNKKAFAGEQEIAYWKNVDMYVGGQEHATGHLLYSRFWHKFLKDLGYVKTEEPFKALRNQGLIMGPDGRKMSKRWGNVINPDDVVDQLGADTLRVYEMFMGPFESSQPWSTDSIVGARRFVERVWKLQEKVIHPPAPSKRGGAELAYSYQKALHKTIKKVTDDIANFSFNTSVSAMMICLNEMEKAEAIELSDFKKLLQILAPFAPHVTDELWSEIGEKKSIHLAPWPKYDPKKIIDDTVTMGIQVNGKVRAEISVSKDISEAGVQEKVLAIPEIAKWIDGKQVRKFIFIPGKIISIVV